MSTVLSKRILKKRGRHNNAQVMKRREEEWELVGMTNKNQQREREDQMITVQPMKGE